MKISEHEIDVNVALDFAEIDKVVLKHRENGILLSDYQVSILERNSFDYRKYVNFRDLLFDIEEYLNDYYDEELDLVSSQIAELIYYRDTKK